MKDWRPQQCGIVAVESGNQAALGFLVVVFQLQKEDSEIRRSWKGFHNRYGKESIKAKGLHQEGPAITQQRFKAGQ